MEETGSLTELLANGPTDENAKRANDTTELLEEVKMLSERVQLLEVIVQEIKYLIINQSPNSPE